MVPGRVLNVIHMLLVIDVLIVGGDMNKTLRLAGVMFSFFITANFYVIVIVAMMHGHSVTVYFNHFREALFEYVMYLIIAPIIFYSFIHEIRLYTRKNINKGSDNCAKKE